MEISINEDKILKTIKKHGGAIIEAGIIQAIKDYAGNVVSDSLIEGPTTVGGAIAEHVGPEVKPMPAKPKRKRRSQAEMKADAAAKQKAEEEDKAKEPNSDPVVEGTPVPQTSTVRSGVDSLFNT
jgi:hypothetical protein